MWDKGPERKSPAAFVFRTAAKIVRTEAEFEPADEALSAGFPCRVSRQGRSPVFVLNGSALRMPRPPDGQATRWRPHCSSTGRAQAGRSGVFRRFWPKLPPYRPKRTFETDRKRVRSFNAQGSDRSVRGKSASDHGKRPVQFARAGY